MNALPLPTLETLIGESGRSEEKSSGIEPQNEHSIASGDNEARSTLVDAIVYGSLGGLVATLSMTAFRMPTNKSLPPTAIFWAKYVGSGEPEDYPVIAIILHLLYGIVSGILFAILTPGDGDSEEVAESKGALLGTAYGTILSVFGTQVILSRVLGQDPDTDERLVFHISHIVYGLTLGTWVGSRFGVDK